MQEFRVNLELLGHMFQNNVQLDEIHDQVEKVGAGLVNTSLIGFDSDIGSVSFTLWLTSMTAYLAISAALNIVAQALIRTGVNVELQSLTKVEAEVSDLLGDLPWPVLDYEPTPELKEA